MSASYLLRTDTPAGALDNLRKHAVDELAAMIVNKALNDFIHSADGGFLDEGEAPIPFQGWFWREVDFFAPNGVTIADGAGQVAVCESNKWGYPERSLTEVEQGEFLGLVWAAWLESHKGGQLSEIQAATRAALEQAGEFIVGLDVPQDDL